MTHASSTGQWPSTGQPRAGRSGVCAGTPRAHVFQPCLPASAGCAPRPRPCAGSGGAVAPPAEGGAGARRSLPPLALPLFLALLLLLPLPARAAEGRAGALFDSLTQSPQDKAKDAARQPKAGQSGPVAPVAPVVRPLGPQAGPEAGAEKPLREVVRERQQGQQPQQKSQQQIGKARAAARNLTFTLTHEGVKRTALVHLPPQASSGGVAGAGAGKGQQARRLPLVVFLHGAGASAAAGMRQTNLTGLADRAGFVAVFPEGLGPEGGQTWNSWTCCGYARDNKVDDVGYLEALLERLKTDPLSGPLLDSRRIYLAGFSNGAMLASRFALERPGVAAAIAVVSGTLPCDLEAPQRPLPVLVIHGDQDRMARYGPTQAHPATGRACEDYPARAQVDYWVRGMGLSAKPRVLEHTRSRSRMEIYEGGTSQTGKKGRGEVRYVVVRGGGHAWPGGAREVFRYCDMPTREPDASALVWEFLSRHSLGAPSLSEKGPEKGQGEGQKPAPPKSVKKSPAKKKG